MGEKSPQNPQPVLRLIFWAPVNCKWGVAGWNAGGRLVEEAGHIFGTLFMTLPRNWAFGSWNVKFMACRISKAASTIQLTMLKMDCHKTWETWIQKQKREENSNPTAVYLLRPSRQATEATHCLAHTHTFLRSSDCSETVEIFMSELCVHVKCPSLYESNLITSLF